MPYPCHAMSLLRAVRWKVCVLCRSSRGQGRERRGHDHAPTRAQQPPLAPTELEPGKHRLRNGIGESIRGSLEDRSSTEGAPRATGSAGKALYCGDWLWCLRRLYAAVPLDCLSTAELVLEQTLHQMPDVAESLLDSMRGVGCSSGSIDPSGIDSPRREGYPLGARRAQATMDDALASMAHELALLLLLLREASPLHACSLPLVPEGMDRYRRAQQAVRSLLVAAARLASDRGSLATATDRVSRHLDGSGDGRGRALAGVRSLLGRVVGTGAGTGAGAGVGGGCLARRALGGATSCGYGGEGGSFESGSSIFSERASQLLDLALAWLREAGRGGSTAGGDGGGDHGGDLSGDDVAAEMLWVVFDGVGGARVRLLRAVLGGVVEQGRGGARCARSFLRAWEGLMAQEAKQQVGSGFCVPTPWPSIEPLLPDRPSVLWYRMMSELPSVACLSLPCGPDTPGGSQDTVRSQGWRNDRPPPGIDVDRHRPSFPLYSILS